MALPAAHAYAYENPLRVLVHPASACAYAYENPLRVLEPVASAHAYAYERAVRVPFHSPEANAYAYENSIPADPNELYVWNEDLGDYVRVPWFVYNINTGQWQQVL